MSVVPAVHKYGFIQVGQSITLYNVHSKVSKEVRVHIIFLSVLYRKMLNSVKPKYLPAQTLQTQNRNQGPVVQN